MKITYPNYMTGKEATQAVCSFVQSKLTAVSTTRALGLLCDLLAERGLLTAEDIARMTFLGEDLAEQCYFEGQQPSKRAMAEAGRLMVETPRCGHRLRVVGGIEEIRDSNGEIRVVCSRCWWDTIDSIHEEAVNPLTEEQAIERACRKLGLVKED